MQNIKHYRESFLIRILHNESQNQVDFGRVWFFSISPSTNSCLCNYHQIDSSHLCYNNTSLTQYLRPNVGIPGTCKYCIYCNIAKNQILLTCDCLVNLPMIKITFVMINYKWIWSEISTYKKQPIDPCSEEQTQPHCSHWTYCLKSLHKIF